MSAGVFNYRMDRERCSTFKLLVPPRFSSGKMSAVSPQEVVGGPGDFRAAQGQVKSFSKDQTTLFPSMSPVVPTKPTRQEISKIKAVPPMEKVENISNPGQVYSKLFNEVQKIKCWKVKVDSDTVQKERRLQENKRTIESQWKAIQDLQYMNESLSIKLEEQIVENDDLRNRNNATRNLCSILKETFQKSAEKMQLFESEREKTHQVFVENSDSIKKLMVAFESLHLQAEANERELQRVNETLVEIEDLKEKYKDGCKQKDEEIVSLQINNEDQEKKLQNTILELDKLQTLYRKLEDSTDQLVELLKSSRAELDSLHQALGIAEQRCLDAQKNRDNVAATLEEIQKQYDQTIRSKDLSLQELNTVKEEQSQQLQELHNTMVELQVSLTQKTQRLEELKEELKKNSVELEKKNKLYEEALEKAAQEVKVIQNLEKELDMNSNVIESLKAKVGLSEDRVTELSLKLSKQTDEMEELKKDAENSRSENGALKQAWQESEMEGEALKQKLSLVEGKLQEMEERLHLEKERSKESAVQTQQLMEDALQEKVKYEDLLSKYRALQSEKAKLQLQLEQDVSRSKTTESNNKANKEKATKLNREIQKLRDDNRCLREELNSNRNITQVQYQDIQTLQEELEEKYGKIQDEIIQKERKVRTLETKVCNLGRKIEVKLKSQEEMKKENNFLKTKIRKETAKSFELQKTIDGLNEESHNFKKLQEENFQKVLNDLGAKSTLSSELEKEVQVLKTTTAEVQRNMEDTKHKCQQKIADMVALMEKHKSQYEKIMEEKDAELNEMKKKEVDAAAHAESLDLDISKLKTENKDLNQRMRIETGEKEKLQKALTDLKNEVAQRSRVKSVPSADSNHTRVRTAETPSRESSSKLHIFDFSKSWTPTYSKDEALRSLNKSKHHHSDTKKAAGSTTNTLFRTSKIKSYRIKTPPWAEEQPQWGTVPFELESKSDSSEPVDLLTFADLPSSTLSASHLREMKSPAANQSPRNSLKMAAMKRIRDAGWTAMIGCEKRKKKKVEKIFV